MSNYSKACGVFADAIAYHNLSAKYDDFGYCDIWPTGDTIDFNGCVQCLQVNDNYLANCTMPSRILSPMTMWTFANMPCSCYCSRGWMSTEAGRWK